MNTAFIQRFDLWFSPPRRLVHLVSILERTITKILYYTASPPCLINARCNKLVEQLTNINEHTMDMRLIIAVRTEPSTKKCRLWDIVSCQPPPKSNLAIYSCLQQLAYLFLIRFSLVVGCMLGLRFFASAKLIASHRGKYFRTIASVVSTASGIYFSWRSQTVLLACSWPLSSKLQPTNHIIPTPRPEWHDVIN